MKHSLKSIAILGLLSLTLVNCSKDRIEEEEINTYGSLNQFYNTYKQPEQEYIISQDGQCPLVAQNGLKLCLGRHQLTMQNGDSVQLPYTIKIIELYTPKDMILYNMPTVSGGDLLTTGGQIRVKAFKGTEELLLRPGHFYTAQVPATNPTPAMEVFYGLDNGTFVDWIQDSLSSSSSVDSSNQYYNLFLGDLTWINCDYFYNYPGAKTQITFTSSTDDLTNVAKFLWFPNANSLMQVYNNASGDVPVNEPVKIICFAADASGTMFSFYQEVTISNNMSVDVTMTQTTESALLTLMDNL